MKTFLIYVFFLPRQEGVICLSVTLTNAEGDSVLAQVGRSADKLNQVICYQRNNVEDF